MKRILFFLVMILGCSTIMGVDYPLDIASGKPLPASYLSSVRLARIGNFKPIGTTLNYVDNLYDLGASNKRWKTGYFGGVTAGSISLTTPLPISSGGTGASTASQAVTNLGILRTVAYASIDGSSGGQYINGGFSTWSRPSTGKYIFTFAVPQPDVYYLVTLTGSVMSDTGNTSNTQYPNPCIREITTSGVEVWCNSYNGSDQVNARFLQIKVERP